MPPVKPSRAFPDLARRSSVHIPSFLSKRHQAMVRATETSTPTVLDTQAASVTAATNATSDETPTPALSIYEELVSQAEDTIEQSYKRFYSAIDGGSTGWSDWVDDAARKRLLEIMTGMEINREFDMWEWCQTTPYTTSIELLKAEGLEIRVLVIPPWTRMTRHYPPGSVALSTLLAGSCSVRSYITSTRQNLNNTRETAHHKYDMDSDAWVYYGGPQRVVEPITADGVSGAASPAVLLEISLNPPARKAPIYSQHTTGLRLFPADNSTESVGEMFQERVIGEEEGAKGAKGSRGKAGHADTFSLTEMRERVGGLDSALLNITRRIFSTRRFPPRVIDKLGLQHVRGMLLYGPPGCGKTLLAREIAHALKAREPKIVSGPEILNKWVGEAEKSIRALFAEAEREQREKGRESALHVVILDEMDAVCKVRGTVTDGGVRDSVVNQLLAKLDGVDQLHNLLVIGLTNRRELIDPALLRPGRLEVQMFVGPPDLEGRKQILHVHLSKIKRNGFASKEALDFVSSGALATQTEGFTGAELAGLVRSAMSFAIVRAGEEAETLGTDGTLVLRKDDLTRAFEEIQRSLPSDRSQKHGRKRARIKKTLRNSWRMLKQTVGADTDEQAKDKTSSTTLSAGSA
eukprot:CAMPEP_0184490640 /NCGR_PEP_ID=MMETSP0113_2-20130426/18444_1 /TAXON_ID=91329 /ORGANISM="Norrisiella sphaerica, Strain BC52" /LENGTH=633 /DNA_ID=CAMNT_0026874619 /DNA_START=353 /DNA_END=2254 /DNA_ORIENTATION=-